MSVLCIVRCLLWVVCFVLHCIALLINGYPVQTLLERAKTQLGGMSAMDPAMIAPTVGLNSM